MTYTAQHVTNNHLSKFEYKRIGVEHIIIITEYVILLLQLLFFFFIS